MTPHRPGARLAVTGSSGQLGGRVARRLAARGVTQRLIVRDAARAPALPQAEVAVAAYGDTVTLPEALRGIDTLYLVSAAEDADRVGLHTRTVDTAVAAGVSRIVYVSFVGAAPAATFTFARDHYHTEQRIRRTGVTFTFLRNSIYLEMLPRFVGTDGVIRGPAGNGRVAAVAYEDIADVAVAVLLDDTGGHDGRTYDVTGPTAFSLAEAAAELSRATGRPVTYAAETLAQAYASRVDYGAPAWEVAGWVTSYAAIATGELDVVSDTVARVAGHEPTSLERYLDSLRPDAG